MNITIEATGLSQAMERLEALTTGAEELIRQRMYDSVQENIVPLAKSLAPKKTGALADSIGVTEGDGLSVNLVATVPYAKYMEYGYAGHWIFPKNARVLHWRAHGYDFFSMYVYIPPLNALKTTFLWPALEQGIDKVTEDIAQLIVDTLVEG